MMRSNSDPKDGPNDNRPCKEATQDSAYCGKERRKKPRPIRANEGVAASKPLDDVELNLLRDAVGLELCISDWEKKGRTMARLQGLELWERRVYLRRSNGVLRYFLSLEADALREAMPRQRTRIMEALITQDLLDESNLKADPEDLNAGAFLRVKPFEFQESDDFVDEITMDFGKTVHSLDTSDSLINQEQRTQKSSQKLGANVATKL